MPSGRAGMSPLRADSLPPPPPAPPACAVGADTMEPCLGPAASDPLLNDDGSMETPLSLTGRKRGAAGPAVLASPAMDLEETEEEPDVCMRAPVEGVPSHALTVVEVESSSEEASDSHDQPCGEPTSQGDAAASVGSPSASPVMLVASGEAPTSPATSSTGSESSSESSACLAPAVSPGPGRPPRPSGSWPPLQLFCLC